MEATKKISIYLFILTISLFLFLRADSDFGHVESGIYFDYTESIVEDGDFNIVDEFFDKPEKKYVTKNYYYPDFHSHGSVIYWNYLYSFGLLVNKSLGLSGDEREVLLQTALSFSSVFFFMLGMILLPHTLSLFNIKLTKAYYFLLPLLTPLYFYTVMEPGNGSIVAFPLVQLFMIAYIKTLENLNYKNSIFLGAFLALSFISKVDSVFYGLLPFHLYFYFYKEKSFITISKYVVVFLCSFFLVNSLQMFNDYLKYGLLAYGYLDTIFTDYNLFFEVLLSSYHGIFYYSPIYIFASLGFIVLLKDSFKNLNLSFLKTKNFLIIYLVGIVVVKLYLFAGSYSHGSGVFGGRQFMCEIPIALICLNYLFNKFKNKYFEYSTLSLCLIWSLIVFFSYRDMSLDSANFTPWDVNSKYYFFNIINRKEEFLSFVGSLFFNFSEVGLKFTWLIVFPLGAAFLLCQLSQKNIRRFTISFLIFFTGTYAVQTSYNFFLGRENVKKMKDNGFMDNALVGNGVRMYFYYENVGSLNERLIFLKTNNRKEEFQQVLGIRDRYHEEATRQILVHPDPKLPIYHYYKEFFTEHHMIEGMKELGIEFP